MESKKPKNFTPLIVVLVLLAAALFLGYFTISKLSNNASIPPSSTKFGLDEDSYNKITQPQDYGVPVSLTEPGYGRVNPFAPYK